MQNKNKIAGKILTSLILGLAFILTPLSGPYAHAQEEGSETGTTLYEPIEKQIIQLSDEGTEDGWKISGLETYGMKVLIRGKEALTWTLNIEDGGFHNPAIEKSYAKVLTIVNSLFILGLLAIAIMWMFSIVIPRKYLKKVILIYSLAVIFVNFALPFNQLLIDGTNLLQKTLLVGEEGRIEITDIVQTPAYSEALTYRNETAESLISGKEKIIIDLEGEGISTPIGTITSPVNGVETVGFTSNPVTITRNTEFSIFQEQTVFRFLMMLATALAYFAIALIFILRIVILWALLILSPVLLLLGIFRTTRGWFINWLNLYGRWLLIGPITALGIAVVVNIWQLSGLPIGVSESYSPEIFTTVKDSNVLFYLPGKDTANTLGNTQEMMEYMIFLIMLYLPIFMAFALTRRKVLQNSAIAISKKIISNSQSSNQSQYIQTGYEKEKETEIQNERIRGGGLIGDIKNLVSEKIGLLTEEALPFNKLETKPEKPTKMMESAHNFLPERLKDTAIPKMLELLGREKDSKKSHEQVIEKLARLENIKDHKEKQQVRNVLNEISERAGRDDKTAMAILHEIQTIKEINHSHIENNGGNPEISGENINIHIGDKGPDDGKKAGERSFIDKNGKKNVKHKKHKHHHRKKQNKENQSSEKSEKKDMNENTPNPTEQNAN